jgi:hypothetical protein
MIKTIERINGGITVVRTNIVPHYLPQSEDDFTIQTLTDMEGNEYEEKVMNPPTLSHYTYDEKFIYNSCTALVTYSQYVKLNESLSKAKGYDMSKDTQRIWPISPTFAKVNVSTDLEGNETFELKCIVEISCENLELFKQVWEGLNLLDSWTVEPFEAEFNPIEIDGLTTEQIDWFLENYNATGYCKDELTIILGDDQPSTLQVIEQLVEKGLIIGIYESD